MKRYIVVCDPYTRYGGGEPLGLDLYEAEDLDTLIRDQLEPGLLEPFEEDEEAPELSPLEYLKVVNGDGMNYYIIKELLPDGTLSEDLLEGE